MKFRLKHIFTAIFIFWIVSFLAFVAIAGWLGGDAWHGHLLSNHYFLGSHRRYTEVSRPVWVYSNVHAISLFIATPLAILLLIGWQLRKTFRLLRNTRNESPPSPSPAASPSTRRPVATRTAIHLTTPLAPGVIPNLEYDSPFLRLLQPGEDLLWVGRPRQGYIFRSWDPLLLGWLYIVLQSVWTTLTSMIDSGFFFHFRPFQIIVLIGGGALFIYRYHFDAKRRAATWYALTSRRVLFVLTRRDVPSFIAVPYDNITDVDLLEHRDASGVITLKLRQYDPYAGSSQVIGGFTAPGRPMLEAVAPAREIYDLLQQNCNVCCT